MYEIIYNGEKIQYEIIRSKIKNMYIHIKEGNVIVKIPLKLKEEKAIEFVNKKSKWIYEKVQETKKKKEPDIEMQENDLQRLENIINKSIQEYSQKLKLYPNKVRIRNIKYAWGSCSSKKNITINMQLWNKEEKVIKYVVLHEMCHLKYMNHSKKFWDLVEKYMPDYRKQKKKLKQ